MAWVLQLHDTPEAIAWGTAIGLMIAFSPTFGFQMLLCIVCSLVFRMNRLMALAVVQITNFVTAMPIYYACYRVGSLMLWRHPRGYAAFKQQVRNVTAAEGTLFEHLNLALGGAWSLAKEVMLPMTLGGLLVGLVCAIPGWYFTRWFVVHHRAKLAEKKGVGSLDDKKVDDRETVQDRRDPEEN